VQSELCLHAPQEFRAWLQQADPDDMSWLLGPFAGFLDRDVFDAASARVDAGGNDAGFAVVVRR
jgi:hypothetical protein